MSEQTIKLLAIDSVGILCSAAVYVSGKTTFAHSQPGQKHTSVIFKLIRTVLKEAGLSLEEMDAFVFGTGPGAFTGIRVSCGIAQGFGWALDKKLIPVCNLEALAYSQLENLQDGATVLIATDARMHECYTAGYRLHGGLFVEVVSPSLQKPETLVRLARNHNCDAVYGNAFSAYSIEIPEQIKLLGTEESNALMLIAPAVQAYKKGLTVSAEKAAPLYVRNHVADTIEERMLAKQAKENK